LCALLILVFVIVVVVVANADVAVATFSSLSSHVRLWCNMLLLPQWLCTFPFVRKEFSSAVM